jgi:hypothetical protein
MSNDFGFPEINTNRTITMVTSGDDRRDWRGSLSRLLGIQSNRKFGNPGASIFDNSETWDVDDRVHLLITENKGLKSESSPDKPLKSLANIDSGKGMIGKIGKIAIGAISALSAFGDTESDTTSGSFYPWISNISAWSGGQSIKLNLKFEFSMGQYGLWNAKEEVVKPILNLLAPTLPQYLDPAMIYGSYPNSWGLLAGFIKGVREEFSKSKSSSSVTTADTTKSAGKNPPQNYVDAYEGMEDMDNTSTSQGESSGFSLQSMAKYLEELALKEYKEYTYDITFGNMFTYYKMLPISGAAELSNEVDQYGFPISGNVNLTYEGLMPVSLSTYTSEELAVQFGQGGKYPTRSGFLGTNFNGSQNGYNT